MKPLFIVGAPRSGTTYVMNGINTHGDVLVTEETRVLNGVVRFINESTEGDYGFLGADAWQQHLLERAPRLVEQWYLKQWIRWKEVLWWGDKNPHYVDRRINPNTLERILEMWPDARFLNVVRDGRDVVSSIATFGWLDVEASSNLWRDSVEYARDFQAEHPESMMTVRYENLVDGSEHLWDVHKWLGLTVWDETIVWQHSQQVNPTPFRSPQFLGSTEKSRFWEEAQTVLGSSLVEHGYDV